MSASLLPKKPRLPSRPSVGRRAPGAPTSPRSYRGTEAERRPEQVPPRWWVHSDLEWITFDYFRRVKHWKILGAPNDPDAPSSYVGADVLFQVPIPAPTYGLKGVFRGDFWVLSTGRNGSPGFPYRKGIVLDPVTTFTHRDTSQDRLRRNLLAQGEFLLIFIDGTDLYNRPRDVIELALKGRDVSTIARNVR
jgi:hypothetical protein